MNYRQRLKSIRAFAFDVDGVFSKEFVVMDNGKLHRVMNAKDGLAIKLATDSKYPVAIITGGRDNSVKERFEIIGVQDVYMGVMHDKAEALEDFAAKYNLSTDEILYMGDDLPDYFIMQKAGFSACPADAVPEIKSVADYIAEKKGGEGCVREIIEQVMKVQGTWDSFLIQQKNKYEKVNK